MQFLGLMACGIIVAAIMLFVGEAVISGGGPRLAGRSALGVDYVSFGIGLAMGLVLAELARLSWSDMPRRAVAWIIANRRNVRYCGYACVWLVVLIYV